MKLFVAIKRLFRKRDGDPRYKKSYTNVDGWTDSTPTNYVRSYDEGRPRK